MLNVISWWENERPSTPSVRHVSEMLAISALDMVVVLLFADARKMGYSRHDHN